mmetsp:Transcript_50919/g.124056  ORF Transcript_50919/g.124056 Transcript_50919/m.124056 type:complete len:246 (+) Transcript_50919:2537-3274(+)
MEPHTQHLRRRTAALRRMGMEPHTHHLPYLAAALRRMRTEPQSRCRPYLALALSRKRKEPQSRHFPTLTAPLWRTGREKQSQRLLALRASGVSLPRTNPSRWSLLQLVWGLGGTLKMRDGKKRVGAWLVRRLNRSEAVASSHGPLRSAGTQREERRTLQAGMGTVGTASRRTTTMVMRACWVSSLRSEISLWTARTRARALQRSPPQLSSPRSATGSFAPSSTWRAPPAELIAELRSTAKGCLRS